jgi:hypothetical protein
MRGAWRPTAGKLALDGRVGNHLTNDAARATDDSVPLKISSGAFELPKPDLFALVQIRYEAGFQ